MFRKNRISHVKYEYITEDKKGHQHYASIEEDNTS
jgi:hypothetical protein